MGNDKQRQETRWFFKILQKVEEVLAEVELEATADDEEYKRAVRNAIMEKLLAE